MLLKLKRRSPWKFCRGQGFRNSAKGCHRLHGMAKPAWNLLPDGVWFRRSRRFIFYGVLGSIWRRSWTGRWRKRIGGSLMILFLCIFMRYWKSFRGFSKKLNCILLSFMSPFFVCFLFWQLDLLDLKFLTNNVFWSLILNKDWHLLLRLIIVLVIYQTTNYLMRIFRLKTLPYIWWS